MLDDSAMLLSDHSRAMKVNLAPDNPINDEACKQATGKTIDQWISAVQANPAFEGKRRDAIQWMYAEMGTKGDVWWPTTLWVEMERRAGKVQKDGRPEGYHICVTKTIAAPVEKVYDAFAKDMSPWYSDAKLASDSSFSDGDGNKATATRVRENKDLRYKWLTAGVEGETDVEVVLQDKGNGKTGLLLNHMRIPSREEADGLRRAWGEAFDRLKKCLE